MRRGIPQLMKEGTRTLSGVEQAVVRNCVACKSLSDITRTSFGPNGMNKMIINHLGKMFVTSDTATIIKELEVEHPAAKLLSMSAGMQEAEIGDGSNFVVVLGGELLGQAEELIHMGLHPSEIISGYNKAFKKALEIMEGLVIESIADKQLFDRPALTRAITSAIASKQFGYESLLAPLVADACLTVMPSHPSNFTVDNVRVVKVLGGSLEQSEVVNGLVIPQDTLTSIKKVENAKIAVFTCSIECADTETKGTVLIENAEQLMNYNLGEEKQIEAAIKALSESGVNVVITGGTVDDMAKHYLEKYHLMTVKLTSKFELRRLCKAVKARPAVQFGVLGQEELGFCSSVLVREVGAQKLTVFKQDNIDSTSVATILLRASTTNILNDVERAIDDGVNVVKAVTRDGRFVAGAGAFEIELARRIGQFAQTNAGLDQYAITKFGEALEVFPRTLAENAGLNGMEIVSQLYAAHEKNEANAGVDVEKGGVADRTVDAIIDLASTKIQGMKLAMDTVLTVLRVDQIIMAKPAGGPKMPKNNGHWDDDE